MTTAVSVAAAPGIKIEIAPLADRLVVRVPKDTGMARGGLHIPDMAREKPQQGDVVAVGPGRFEKDKRVPMDV